jgi:hypothetical protein
MGIAAAISMLGATLASTRVAGAGDPRVAARPSAAPHCRGQRAATGADATAAEADIATLFAEYQCWLGAAEYRAALEALERACAGSDDAACPFNRALVHHAWLEVPGELDREHCQTARSNYAHYLALEPYEEQSDAARSALAELAAICEPEAAAPSGEPTVDSAVDAEVIPALAALVLGKAPSLEAPSQDGSLEDTPPEGRGAPVGQASDGRGRDAVGDGDMDGKAQGTHAPAASALSSPSPPERRLASERPKTLSWLLLGAGSASALATAVAGLSMSRADADLARRARAGVVYPSTETKALDASRRRYQGWVWGFGVGAVALLGAGTTLLLVDPALPPYLSVSLAPGLAMVGYDASF